MAISNVSAGALIDPAWGNSVADELNHRGMKARATKTSTQTFTTVVDISGLSVTWTAIASRLYLITFTGGVFSTVTADLAQFTVTDASNVQKSAFSVPGLSTVYGFNFHGSYCETGLSGSVTRKVRGERLAGTGTITYNAGATLPGMLLVQDIGPA